MRLITIAAMVALTITATTGEAAARGRHHGHARHHHHRHRQHRVVEGANARMIVTQEAARAGVPQRLAHAIIRVESGYNCRARNASGASGAGQLMPATARAMGVRNSMDCRQNIAGSMRYLRQAISKGGAGCSGVSLYNTGTGARPHCTAYGRRVMSFAGM